MIELIVAIGAPTVGVVLFLWKKATDLDNHGDKFREDYVEHAQVLQNRTLLDTCGDYVNGAIERINHLSKKDERIMRLKKELGTKLANDETSSTTMTEIWNAVGDYKIEVKERKVLRESMEEVISGVRKFEDERTLFKNAWSSEKEVGRRVALFGVSLLGLATGILFYAFLLPLADFFGEYYPTVVLLGLVLLFVYAYVLANYGKMTWDDLRKCRDLQDKFIAMRDTEIYDTEPMQTSIPEARPKGVKGK